MMAVLPRSTRKFNLLPVQVCVQVLRNLGDGPRTRAIIVGLGSEPPRLWELRAEAERNRANLEEDLVLNDQLAEEEDALEQEEMALTQELAGTFELFKEDEADEQTSRTYVLQRPSSELLGEIKALESYKMASLCRFRRGAACVDTTFENTKGALLRFLGWFRTHGPNACAIRMATVFSDARLGEWCEGYLRWCQEVRSCKSSSLANYCTGLINTLQYVLVTSEVEPAHGLSTADQLLNLRHQLESQAREERLYARRHPEFIPWPEVQATRIAAQRAYDTLPAAASLEIKRKAAIELLLVLWFSVAPPDRCGVVRRLRFGHTLKKDASWTIDLTKFRHKVTRHCVITSWIPVAHADAIESRS